MLPIRQVINQIFNRPYHSFPNRSTQFAFVLLFIASCALPVTAQQDWNDLSVDGPDPRLGHSMISDSEGRIILFMGGDGVDKHNDLWIFNNAGEWNDLDPQTAPEPRSGQTVATLPDGSVMLFGGDDANNEPHNDLWEYRDGQWSQVQVTNSPSPRTDHAMWINEDQNRLYGYGGYNGDQWLDDIWFIDLIQFISYWAFHQGAPPALLYPISWCNNNLVYIAGAHEDSPETARMYRVDIFSGDWTQMPDPPIPPGGQAVAQDNNRAFVIGGRGSALKETWEFDFAAESWTRRADLPIALRDAAAAIRGGNVILFGGMTDADTLSGLNLLVEGIQQNAFSGAAGSGNITNLSGLKI
jgi:hypothetical protein